jgi:hypothetical protein
MTTMTMTGPELIEAFKSGRRDFTGANLSDAYLGGANLGGADLGGAYLGGAYLGGANLRGANLSDADLGGADLGGAYLGGANLRGANLVGAYLGGAYLGGANLGGADLGGAYLRGANLGGANLRSANLRGSDMSSFVIVPAGALEVYKKTSAGVVTLLIPRSAARVNAYGSRKCRAEYALVLDAPEGAVSQHDNHTKYVVGETVYPDSYDPDPRIECSHGIHFFLTRTEAENW